MMKITTLQTLNLVGKMWRWGGTMNECIEYHKQGDRQWHTFCKTRTFLRLCIRPTTPHAHSSWFYIKRQNSLIIEMTTAWTGTIQIDVREKGALKNGQSRDTDNIGHNTQNKEKKTTTQNTKKWTEGYDRWNTQYNTGYMMDTTVHKQTQIT